MTLSPLVLSLKTASVAIVITFFLGLLFAHWMTQSKATPVKLLLDGFLTLPLVLPPTVVGFFLLMIFGVNRPIGRFLLDFMGFKMVFSWWATVLAAVVVSFPLMYRSARGAFEQVNTQYIMAARTLRLSEWHIFWRIQLPLAFPGVAAGGILAFARGLGEFGATAMIAGNILDRTRTLPLAIYSEVAAGNMDAALYYVWIVLGLSFVLIIGMNCLAIKSGKYFS